jgi:hypothetical protein
VTTNVSVYLSNPSEKCLKNFEIFYGIISLYLNNSRAMSAKVTRLNAKTSKIGGSFIEFTIGIKNKTKAKK